VEVRPHPDVPQDQLPNDQEIREDRVPLDYLDHLLYRVDPSEKWSDSPDLDYKLPDNVCFYSSLSIL
jgi:hypothetical protein